MVDKQHPSSRRVSQERGDRKCSSPHGSASSGVCVTAETGWYSACQLPASCPPVCVLQALEACNYISQAPVRFCEWEEAVRGGEEAQGRETQHFPLLQVTSQVAAAEVALGGGTSAASVHESLSVHETSIGNAMSI